jgi:hypothetical protein
VTQELNKMSEQPEIVAVQTQRLTPYAAAPTAVITYKSEGNGHVEISGNVNGYQQTFSRLPRRTPVEMQFENIGFRKGMAF